MVSYRMRKGGGVWGCGGETNLDVVGWDKPQEAGRGQREFSIVNNSSSCEG